MKKIPVCYRSSESNKIEIAEVAYEGPLEAKTMRRVNRLFLEKAGSGYFYPLEPMDAYGDVWLALEQRAAALPELAKATRDTYLNAVARIQFLNWFKRKVEPMRKTYRQVEDQHFGKKGAVGVDDFDADNYDPTQGNPSAALRKACKHKGIEDDIDDREDFSLQRQGEALPDEHDYDARRIRAHEALEELYAHLPTETVRALRAYVHADGNLFAAARIAHTPKSTYYRRWPGYLAQARKVGNLLGGFDTIWYRR